MSFFMYLSGLIGIVTIGAGVAVLYVNVPQSPVHLEINRPNSVLKLISAILIIGGLLNLIGNIFFAITEWREKKPNIAWQTENPPKTETTVPQQEK
jgi:hypothetical protein